MTEPNHVPCWLYHSEQGAKIFTTQADLDEAIAQGWADSPAAARPAVDIDNVRDALEAAEAAIEQGESGAIEEALEAAEEAIEKVQVVVSKKHKRRS